MDFNIGLRKASICTPSLSLSMSTYNFLVLSYLYLFFCLISTHTCPWRNPKVFLLIVYFMNAEGNWICGRLDNIIVVLQSSETPNGREMLMIDYHYYHYLGDGSERTAVCIRHVLIFTLFFLFFSFLFLAIYPIYLWRRRKGRRRKREKKKKEKREKLKENRVFNVWKENTERHIPLIFYLP